MSTMTHFSTHPRTLAIQQANHKLFTTIDSPEGSVEEVKQLIEQGADVNAKLGRFGSNALQSAALVGRVDMMEALIEAQANVNFENKAGCTALKYAVGESSKLGLELLLKHKADPNIGSRVTPLHQTAIQDLPEYAQTLIERGAKIDAFDAKGFTPLHKAVKERSYSVANVLVKNGANLRARDGDGESGFFNLPEAVTDSERFRRVDSVQVTASRLLPIFRLFLDPDKKS